MKEIEEHEFKEIEDDLFLLYLYTPFCGTCQLAKKMLAVVDAMQPDVPFYENNLNYSPGFAKAFEIESVLAFSCLKRVKSCKKAMPFTPFHIFTK